MTLILMTMAVILMDKVTGFVMMTVAVVLMDKVTGFVMMTVAVIATVLLHLRH